jgi:hypothetical protein
MRSKNHAVDEALAALVEVGFDAIAGAWHGALVVEIADSAPIVERLSVELVLLRVKTDPVNKVMGFVAMLATDDLEGGVGRGCGLFDACWSIHVLPPWYHRIPQRQNMSS